MVKITSLALAVSLFAGGFAYAEKQRGVALVIADGTSVELLSTARVYLKGAQGRLELEKFPHSAFVSTWSKNSMVTDSSAGATALARGFKAVNGRVGIVDAEGETGPSIIDIAKAKGWATAVLSDDCVQGATPSSFMVEHKNRGDYPEIAAKILPALGKRVDLVMGGGRQWYFPPEGFYTRKPEDVPRGATVEAAMKQYKGGIYKDWDTFKGSLDKIDLNKEPVLGLFADDTFAYLADGTKKPLLAEMVDVAVTLLEKTGKPYVIVVEAGLPDKASHQNQGKRALTEIAELDSTLALLNKRMSEDSLIVSTTDHGTGGIALNGYLPLKSEPDSMLRPNAVSGMPIVSWATGPGGVKPDGTRSDKDPTAVDGVQPAAAYIGSAMHTGGDVWAIARGPGSEKVSGFIDNTDIFRILKEAVEKK